MREGYFKLKALFLLENSFFEKLTSPELGLRRGRDIYLFPGLWVDADSCGSLCNPKGPEAGYGDILAAAHRLNDGIEERLNGLFGLLLRIHLRPRHHGFDKILFLHLWCFFFALDL